MGAIVMIAGAGNAAQVITDFDPGVSPALPMVTLAAAQTWVDGAAVTLWYPRSYLWHRARPTVWHGTASISFRRRHDDH